MANYTSNSFLLPLNNSDKIIQIRDRFNLNRISLNGQNVKTTLVISNIVKIDTLDQIIQLDFVSNNDAKIALSLLQSQIDTVRSNFPLLIVGPTGPAGVTGPVGPVGPVGPTGLGFLYNLQDVLNNGNTSSIGILLNSTQSYFGFLENNYIQYIYPSTNITNNIYNYLPNYGGTFAVVDDILLLSQTLYNEISSITYSLSYIQNEINNISFTLSNYYLNSNPSGYITQSSLDPYALTSSLSNYYLNSNPSGYITQSSLNNYGGVQQYENNNYFPIPGNPNILYIDLSTNLSWYWATQSATYSSVIDTFQNDIPVSLSNGKTFGRYSNGSTISAIGKTPAQVILQATIEPIAPSVSISTTPTSLIFNQPNPIITINFGYTINSLGATANTGLLQYYSNSSLTWNTIYNTIGDSITYSISGFTYAIPDIDNPQFNTNPFQFRYLVTDTLSATNSSFSNVNISSYSHPTISNFLGSASHINLSIETNNSREIGNTSTILKGNVTRNSLYVPILYYQYFIKINNGNYVNIGPTYSISSNGGSFTNYIDTSATSSATTITYEVIVTDAYTTTIATYAINYNYVIFYGPVNISSTNSLGVRSNLNYQFINGANPFILNTGTIYNTYEVALPSSHLITSVTDLDALNASLTSNYVLNNFNINDGGGTPTLYNIYDMVSGIPYPSNHRHQINYS